MAFRPVLAAATALTLLWAAPQAAAFCGFYVARADAQLFNNASKVVYARDGNRTVITMANDYEGEPEEFAMVVPAPYVLERRDIRVMEAEKIEAIDAYSAPRLVEYRDPDPCNPRRLYRKSLALAAPAEAVLFAPAPAPQDFGVTVEAQYAVEEYDILILSAQDSNGLQRWLELEGYNLPPATRPVLADYIAKGMKFFVARVDLSRMEAATDPDWDGYLRPLQISFNSEKFMLPIRLGMVNAKGPQDLLVFFLTREGRVETSNYPVIPIPTGDGIPPTVEARFDDFYRAVFDRTHEAGNRRSVVTEYSWPLQQKCDPCVAGTPGQSDLIDLGATWLAEEYAVSEEGVVSYRRPDDRQVGPAHLTRLHMRYSAETFPEDLVFRETDDAEAFQGRYVMRHPFRGNLGCPAGREYLNTLNARHKEEARTLAALTGWELGEISDEMRAAGYVAPTVSATGEYSFDNLRDWRAWTARKDGKN